MIPVSKRHEDLLSFLIQLNRVQLPEGSEESEDILSEFELLLSDAKERGFSESDAVLETPDIRCHPRRNNGLEPLLMHSGDLPESSASDVRPTGSEAQVQNPDVKNEVTNVELDLPAKETKMAGSTHQSLVGLTKRYAGLTGSPTIGEFCIVSHCIGFFPFSVGVLFFSHL